jgi:uncharacterized protein YndB with AHSA1/START domain
MSNRNVVQSMFTVRREYPVSPARVFAAFADVNQKRKWFNPPPDWNQDHAMDFRVGGKEHSYGGPKGGQVHKFDAVYQDIVPNERIIYTYDMHLDDTRISVSLAVIEFKAKGGGTQLIITEHGAYLDGHSDGAASREHGTNWLIDKMGETLKG